LNAPSLLGITYPSDKWIFIGAKSCAANNREQKIKGIIIRELCHYVLCLVYENNGRPYYQGDEDKEREFEDILNEYRMYGDPNQDLDDECGGIISEVYKKHESKIYHNLITIAPQIQVQCHKNGQKLKYFKLQKYKFIFTFFDNLIPELEKYNFVKRQNVRDINKISNILVEIPKLRIGFLILKEPKYLLRHPFVVVTTNQPKLLLLYAYKYLRNKDGNLLDVKNLFISPKAMRKSTSLEDVIKKSKPQHVIVDCSEEIDQNLIFTDKSNFMFIVRTEAKAKELVEIIEQREMSVEEIKMDYSWQDLTNKSKIELLQGSKVDFQDNVKFSLSDLFSDVSCLDEIIDDHTLNLLIEKSQISLNSKIKDEGVDKNFPILFQPRTFQSIDVGSTHLNQTEGESSASHQNAPVIISCDQLIENVKESKYVLISDIAGTGKTWALKNIADQLRCTYPTKWTTFVDLKEFIQEFKLTEIIENFTNFMIKNILKLTNNFEEKIFTKLYENGNVDILFDGYDEIAPDCVANVLRLFKSFQSNNGNQMWIATRKFFEESLTKELKLSTVYKLNKFAHGEEIKILALNLIVNDQGFINCSTNYKKQNQIANNFIMYILKHDMQSMNFPIFLFKMLADVLKKYDIEMLDNNILIPKVYAELVKLQSLRWSHDKGELMKIASAKPIYANNLNYRKLHQLFAMKSFFPESTVFCDLNFNRHGWSDEEIIACGVLDKKDGAFYFIHQLFQHYYAADFIVRCLEGKVQNPINLCEYLIKILTLSKYKIVRLFLNYAIGERQVPNKINQKMPKISKILFADIEQIVNLSAIFDENLENLCDFLFNLFKNGTFENARKIFNNNSEIIYSITSHPKLFDKFTDFMLNTLKVDDLNYFIKEQNIFQKLVDSSINDGTITIFKYHVEQKSLARL